MNPKENDNIRDEYKKNYEDKQQQWKVEDINQGNLEKLEKEKKKETKFFLNQIRRRPRFAQIFVDQYSLRDENVNKNIIEISKYLGRNLYEKKNMNLKIDKFLEELEKNNQLKGSNPIDDEDSLNKEQILLQQMVLKNFEDEQDEENYSKLGIKEKEEILPLLGEVREEKTREQEIKENFEMFKKFKNDVINKETKLKNQNKTQFKNEIVNYLEHSATKKKYNELNHLNNNDYIYNENNFHSNQNSSSRNKSNYSPGIISKKSSQKNLKSAEAQFNLKDSIPYLPNINEFSKNINSNSDMNSKISSQRLSNKTSNNLENEQKFGEQGRINYKNANKIFIYL